MRTFIVCAALALLAACGGSGTDSPTGAINITCFNIGQGDQECIGAAGNVVDPGPCAPVVDGSNNQTTFTMPCTNDQAPADPTATPTT